MKTNLAIVTLCAFILGACHSANSESKKAKNLKETAVVDSSFKQKRPAADVASILAKKQVPVLCYHHIREPKSTDGPSTKNLLRFSGTICGTNESFER